MITLTIHDKELRRIFDNPYYNELISSVDKWLLELSLTKRNKISYRIRVDKRKMKIQLTFVRREDAISFKLKFGL